MKHTNQHQRLQKAWRTLQLSLAIPADWETADLRVISYQCTTPVKDVQIFWDLPLEFLLDKKFLYLIVIYKIKGHL